MATIRSFDLVSAGANHYVVVAGGLQLCNPVEFSDPQSRIRFAQDFARERGWAVSAVPPGGVGRYELASPVDLPGATIDPRDVQFSVSSLEAIGNIGRTLSSVLRRMAQARAAEQGKSVADPDDVFDVIPAALAKTADVFDSSKIGL
jgi:hypothetical protein